MFRPTIGGEVAVPQDFNITATSPTSRTEPKSGWSIETNGFSMSKIRNQLGATSRLLSSVERGVMDLSIDRVFTEVQRLQLFSQDRSTKGNYNLCTYPNVPGLIWSSIGKKTLLRIYCSNCTEIFSQHGIPGLIHTNNMQDVMIAEVLNDTANSAMALQAQLVMLLRTAYYDSLPIFNYNATYSAVSVTQKLIPGAKFGLCTVLILVTLHLLLVGLVVARFCLGSRLTLLNNAWLVVSQVHTAEMERV